MVDGTNIILTHYLVKDQIMRKSKIELFYVAITRAKKNLIIYMPKNDSRIIEKAKCFFEKDDIIDVMSLVDE